MQKEKPPDFITAGELMDQQFLPRNAVVEGFLPVGTYILAGAPKCGKSFWVTQLCWCVAEGVPFLGFQTQQAETLYLALEDTPERLQNRLNRMFGVEWSGEQFHLKFQTELQGESLIKLLDEYVAKHPDIRLIVIDTLQRVRTGDGSAYSCGNDYGSILPFKTFTDTHDLALILVHHTRKNTEDDNPFNQISGTNGLLGAADGAFVLRAQEAETVLDYTGRDLPAQQYGLKFDREVCQWKLLRVGKPVMPNPPEPLLDLIDEVIQDDWSGTATELLTMLCEVDPTIGYTANTLSRKLNHLTSRLAQEKRIMYFKSRRSEMRSITFLRRKNDDNDDKTTAVETSSLPSSGSENALQSAADREKLDT